MRVMARTRGRQFAVLRLSIWDDPDFAGLTADQQLVYIMAISSPDLSYAGVFPLLTQRFTRISDLTDRRVRNALDALAQKRYLVIDRETGEVCVRTYIRHDGVLKQPNVVRAMNKAYEKVHSGLIRETIRDEVAKALGEGFPQGFPQGLSKALEEGFAKDLLEGLV